MSANMDPVTRSIDVDGMIDPKHNGEKTGHQIRYIGRAYLQPNGKFVCLADVAGMLCRVEVSIVGDIQRK